VATLPALRVSGVFNGLGAGSARSADAGAIPCMSCTRCRSVGGGDWLGRVRCHASICAWPRDVGQQNLVTHRGASIRGRHDALAMSSCLSQRVPQPVGVGAGVDWGPPEILADRRAVAAGTVRTLDVVPCRADARWAQDVISGSRPRFDPICMRRSPREAWRQCRDMPPVGAQRIPALTGAFGGHGKGRTGCSRKVMRIDVGSVWRERFAVGDGQRAMFTMRSPRFRLRSAQCDGG
jgi:hypothetical protein